jgi:hypothetical protein
VAKTPFQQMPTLASVDGLLKRVAMRVVSLESELSGENPEGQLTRIWESIEELNLRVLFLMNTLMITKTLSPIAGTDGKIPVQRMTALEAYMVGGGREKILAQVEAQAKAAEAAMEAQDGESIPPQDGEGQAETAGPQLNGATVDDADAIKAADEAAASESGDVGAPTLVANDLKTKH